MSTSITKDLLRDNNFKYFLNIRRRINRIGLKRTLIELKRYYYHYSQFPKKIGIFKIDSKYKSFVFYNYFKIVSIHPSISEEDLMKYFPTRLQKYFIYILDPKEKREITYDKLLFYNILAKEGLPFPLVYFYTDEHQFKNLDGSLFDKSKLAELPIQVFVKPARENGGVGAGLLFSKNINSVKNGMIVQSVALNHPELIRIGGNFAFNTVRAITYIDNNNKIHLLSAILRLSAGEQVDNWGRGSVNVNIDTDSGELGNYGLNKKGERFSQHPTSDVKFEGFKLPFWEQMISTMFTAAETFSYLRLIAWDIGIGESGPIIVEANAGCDFFHAQLFKPYGDSVLIKDLIKE